MNCITRMTRRKSGLPIVVRWVSMLLLKQWILRWDLRWYRAANDKLAQSSSLWYGRSGWRYDRYWLCWQHWRWIYNRPYTILCKKSNSVCTKTLFVGIVFVPNASNTWCIRSSSTRKVVSSFPQLHITSLLCHQPTSPPRRRANSYMKYVLLEMDCWYNSEVSIWVEWSISRPFLGTAYNLLLLRKGNDELSYSCKKTWKRHSNENPAVQVREDGHVRMLFRRPRHGAYIGREWNHICAGRVLQRE